jgi:methanogenic corrinoid protein MtbC1
MPVEPDKTDIAQLIAHMDEHGSLAAVRRRLDAGEDPLLLIEECRKGMELVGSLYERGTYFISALIMAGEIFREVTEILLPHLEAPPVRRTSGTFVIATVKGDIHDIGKNIASLLLETHGFTVVDLGVDVSPEMIADTVADLRPDMLGLSCLLTNVFDSMGRTIGAVRERTSGWKRRVPIVIGGAPVDQIVCDQMGADGWCADAADGIRVVKSLLD